MPQRIVDVLEMIKVEIKNGKGCRAAFGASERKMQPVQKRDTIGQAGQAVSAGKFDDGLLGRLARRDVAEEPDAAQSLLFLLS